MSVTELDWGVEKYNRDKWAIIPDGSGIVVNYDGSIWTLDRHRNVLRLWEEVYDENLRSLTVDVPVPSNVYDYDAGDWVYETNTYMVWNLVVEAWISGWDWRHMEVLFFDGDPSNCSVDNIRATFEDPRWGGKRIVGRTLMGFHWRLDKRKVADFINVATGKRYFSLREAAEDVGGSVAGVSQVLSGKRRKHRGVEFRWS